MIRRNFKISKKTAAISAILAVVIVIGAVFASGILRGTVFAPFSGENAELNTDEVIGNEFNLLFVGVDNGGRADTVMLVKVQTDAVNCISIPRNTLMDDKRISDIFAEENGDGKIIDAVRKTLSVPVNYYAEMNLSAVGEIVDGFGGVEFEVPTDMVYDDEYQNLHINLKKGVKRLSGEEVCGLLQFRKGYDGGDLSRIQLHQRFLNEFIAQKFNKENLGKAPKIFEVIADNVKTNYSAKDFGRDVKNISKIITFETLPGKIANYENMPVYEID